MARVSQALIDTSIKTLKDTFGSQTVSYREINDLCKDRGLPVPGNFLLSNKVGTKYCFSKNRDKVSFAPAKKQEPAAVQLPQNVVVLKQPEVVRSSSNTAVSYIPARHKGYVKFGNYAEVEAIIASRQFYPVYISGMSGNGKTLTVQEVCAKLRRELIQININPQTDEDDLIGGLRLRDGSTLFDEGPVLTAMRRGAVLLLDETDRGSNKLMCLQSILEGRPYFVKKTGETVTPTEGFTIIATANTKGRGSDDGRYSAATIIDDAWLERFPVTLVQPYPPEYQELRIVENSFEEFTGDKQADFAKLLVSWAVMVRKAYEQEAIDEMITTRRLVHITKAFAIFKDRMKSIEMCVNRFDDTVKSGLMDFYTKVDASINPPVVPATEPAPVTDPVDPDNVPF